MSTINIDLAADTILNVMIGQQDENEVREVVFDFSGWYTTYGSGTISLAIQRPKDEWPYEGTLTVDSTNHKATWEISETDTAYAGTGQIQLSYKVGDAKKKSVVYRFTCHKSLGALGSVVTPVQIQTFIDEVEEALQTMDGKLDDMEDEITDVKADLSEQQNLLYIDVTENMPTPENAWIRYSNGEKVSSSATRLFILPSDNIKVIHAFLTSDTNVLCAIAFYSTTTVSTEGYIQSASVDFPTGTHNDGLWYDATVPSNCKCIAITTKIPSATVAEYIIKFDVGYIENDVKVLSTKIDDNTEAISNINTSLGTYATKDGTNYGNFIGRLKPCYDHLFVNRTGENVIIPHESVYHIRISAKLGFNCIEANIAETSDGVFIVNHLNVGKFGGYFHHVDGVTDISNIAVSSVTWAWIAENVRYNSTIPKYRTRPCTLEEFLGECKQQNIIPFATATNPNMITIIENIMGKNNYIAYGATRENAPNAIIYHWVSNLTTKQAILDYCNNIGKPFIFGLGNASSFTDEQLAEIVSTLHQNGFMIGTSYDDTKWYKYSALGFDFNGTQYLTNRLENGNICNFDTVFNYNDFTISNGTETDGIITFATDGSIRPNIADTVLPVGLIDIEVNFSGKIVVQTRSLFGNYTIESTEKMLYYISAPLINGHPKITIVCYEGTTIYDIKFKASKC